MSEIDSKLCKICLNSNTDIGLAANSSLNKFFSHILGINEPLVKLWLCAWCKSVLRKTMRLIILAQDTQRILSDVNMTKTINYNNEQIKTHKLFSLSIHHSEHYEIPPKKRKSKLKTNKTKRKMNETNKIQFVHLSESSDLNTEVKVKDENKMELEIDEVKVEEMETEVAAEGIDVDDEHYERNDRNDNANNDIKLENSKTKISSKLYDQCEENDFTFKVLTVEEQIAELEEKKKSEKYLSRKFKCEFCGIGFVTKDVYDEHNQRHQESHSTHKCQVCHLRFSTSLVLSQHQLAHSRRFTCKLCRTVLCRYSDCRTHRLKCGRTAPGVCHICNKIFSNQESLKGHMRGVHYKKEKKFVCSFCNQRFQSKQRHAIHTRTHTGAKPYSCDLCHRSFAANSNLRNHLYTHEQARPHYCVECDKSYKTHKGLRRHLLQGAQHLNRKYSCQHCLKNFASEKLLASHINSAHTKEYPCALCNKTFCSTGNLKKHTRCVHETPDTPA